MPGSDWLSWNKKKPMSSQVASADHTQLPPPPSASFVPSSTTPTSTHLAQQDSFGSNPYSSAHTSNPAGAYAHRGQSAPTGAGYQTGPYGMSGQAGNNPSTNAATSGNPYATANAHNPHANAHNPHANAHNPHASGASNPHASGTNPWGTPPAVTADARNHFGGQAASGSSYGKSPSSSSTTPTGFGSSPSYDGDSSSSQSSPYGTPGGSIYGTPSPSTQGQSSSFGNAFPHPATTAGSDPSMLGSSGVQSPATQTPAFSSSSVYGQSSLGASPTANAHSTAGSYRPGSTGRPTDFSDLDQDVQPAQFQNNNASHSEFGGYPDSGYGGSIYR